MEEFKSDIHKENKPTTFPEKLNPDMELLNSFSEMNQPLNSYVFDSLSSDNFLDNNDSTKSTQWPYTSNIPLQLFNHPQNTAHFTTQSSPAFGSSEGGHKNNNNVERKRKRKGDEETEKPKEVIHVRAKRGQATDSHSLAERVRRERINEKLKLLQDLVPGCYKTMGMAVMLDVIINYVRSLQNQIEFLSMKLSAASMFYDFNSPEAEAIENLQRTTNPCDVHEMERIAREGFGGTLPRSHSSWPF